MLIMCESDLYDDLDPEVDAVWKEIDQRELEDELYLQAEELDDFPLSQEECEAWDAYLDSPEGQAAMQADAASDFEPWDEE